MPKTIDDERVIGYRPLISPTILKDEINVSNSGLKTIIDARSDAENVIKGLDDRLLVVVGPCSIHDPQAAIEYAEKLRPVKKALANELLIIMRVYFEKPRTTVGWKGLINDPALDNTFDINSGLKVARKLLCDLANMGMPSGSEFLDVVTPQFIADLISWGAIGARTTESQVHRELASGSSMPIGFKNGTAGSIQVAIDAIMAAQNSHSFLGVTEQAVAAIVSTRGNTACHLILRGSNEGTNYNQNDVTDALNLLRKNEVKTGIMIDCSHGNSFKNHEIQPEVADNICLQISNGADSLCGVMLESFLVGGKQPLNKPKLVYGQSITDACLSWEMTEPLLFKLGEAVNKRRNLKKG